MVGDHHRTSPVRFWAIFVNLLQAFLLDHIIRRSKPS
jgi:hypothetical protein